MGEVTNVIFYSLTRCSFLGGYQRSFSKDMNEGFFRLLVKFP